MKKMSTWCRYCGKENGHHNFCVALEVEDLRAALRKFVSHFGPLSDNPMLHQDARECFRLAERALSHSRPRPSR